MSTSVTSTSIDATIRAEAIERLEAVLCHVHRVAVRAQSPPDEIAHGGIVVCEQDRRHVTAPPSILDP